VIEEPAKLATFQVAQLDTQQQALPAQQQQYHALDTTVMEAHVVVVQEPAINIFIPCLMLEMEELVLPLVEPYAMG
jgi:hypothetical protein